LEPEWDKAAKALKGVIKVGAVDMDADPQAGAAYDVKGFPTIKFFGLNKKKGAIAYEKGRTAKDIVNWSLNQIVPHVTKRITGKSDGGGESSSSGGKGKGGSSGGGGSGDSDVVVLTEDNYDTMVM
jgi:protein disulfide-isomerase A6